MSLRLALAFAALASFAMPAFAAGSNDGRDDALHADVQATFTNAVDPSPVVTDDVVYPGPHAAFAKALPSAAPQGALASFDDTTYPTSTEPAQVAAPAATAVAAQSAGSGAGAPACHCPCG